MIESGRNVCLSQGVLVVCLRVLLLSRRMRSGRALSRVRLPNITEVPAVVTSCKASPTLQVLFNDESFGAVES